MFLSYIILGVFCIIGTIFSFKINSKYKILNLILNIIISIIFFVVVLITYNNIIQASKINNLQGQWGLIKNNLFGDVEIIIGIIPIIISYCYAIKKKIMVRKKIYIVMIFITIISYITLIDVSSSVAYMNWRDYLYDCMFGGWFFRYFCLLININFMFRILDND